MAVVCPNCGQGVRGGETFCGADLQIKENTGKPNQTPLATDTTTAATFGCGLMAVIYYFCGASYYLAGDMLHAAHLSRGAPASHDLSQWLFWRAYGVCIGFGAPIAITGLPYFLLR